MIVQRGAEVLYPTENARGGGQSPQASFQAGCRLGRSGPLCSAFWGGQEAYSSARRPCLVRCGRVPLRSDRCVSGRLVALPSGPHSLRGAVRRRTLDDRRGNEIPFSAVLLCSGTFIPPLFAGEGCPRVEVFAAMLGNTPHCPPLSWGGLDIDGFWLAGFFRRDDISRTHPCSAVLGVLVGVLFKSAVPVYGAGDFIANRGTARYSSRQNCSCFSNESWLFISEMKVITSRMGVQNPMIL